MSQSTVPNYSSNFLVSTVSESLGRSTCRMRKVVAERERYVSFTQLRQGTRSPTALLWMTIIALLIG
jgi:hypothetical protein